MNHLLCTAAAGLLLSACGRRDAPRFNEPAVARTSVTASRDTTQPRDHQGTNTGVFPAADAPGIAVTLTLDPDGRFTELLRFCERPGESVSGGRYAVTGNMLTLRPDSPKEAPSYYRVNRNTLRRLDSQQQPITGPFADLYVLTRSESGAEASCY